jgi:hypothetical protein
MLASTKRILFSAPILLALAALGWGGNTIAARVAVGEVSPMMLGQYPLVDGKHYADHHLSACNP